MSRNGAWIFCCFLDWMIYGSLTLLVYSWISVLTLLYCPFMILLPLVTYVDDILSWDGVNMCRPEFWIFLDVGSPPPKVDCLVISVGIPCYCGTNFYFLCFSRLLSKLLFLLRDLALPSSCLRFAKELELFEFTLWLTKIFYFFWRKFGGTCMPCT